jgi:site-specific DNA-cytosine methylase
MAEDWRELVLTIQSVGYSACGVEFGGCKGILHVDAEWAKHLVVGTTLSIRNYQMQWYEGEIHFNATRKENAQLFLHASEKRGMVHTIETFAGIGSWSQVLSHFDDKPVLMVEVDVITANALAKQLNVECLSAEGYVQRVLLGSDVCRCVLADSVENPWVWVAAGLANVGRVVGSPPCPPWSGAGTNKGLSCSDGVLFQSHLEWAAVMRMQTVVLENVPGLAKHDDFKSIVRHVASKGLVLQLHGTFSCHQVLPVRRDRWLATFVHKDVALDSERVRVANAISFACNMFARVAKEPTLGSSDVVHTNCSVDERVELQVPSDAHEMMGKVDVAPWWLKSKVVEHTPENLVQGRVVGEGQQCPCFMASYGKQHEIDVSLLRGKGLQTILFEDAAGVRMLSPWEMLAAMAYKPTTVLSSDVFTAWKQAGNGLTAAHAWLAMHKTHVMLGGQSPWKGQPDPVASLGDVLQAGIQMSKYETCKQGGFWVLVECLQEPSAKKAKTNVAIPPTVPFTAVDSDAESAPGTKPFVRKPVFVQVNDPRCHAAFKGLGNNGLVVLEHVEKNWVMFVNVHAGDVIASVVQKGLPHAQPEHFLSLRVDDFTVGWSQVLPRKPVQTLVFDPVYFQVTCHEESLRIDLKFLSDVTWTGRTAIAFCAQEVGCSPDAIALFHGNVNVADTTFLAAYETTDFTMKFKACMPSYVSWEPHGQTKDPGFVPAGKEMRWFARHPNRKVVRTCSIDADAEVGKLVQMLFPDLHANTPWSVFNDGEEVEVHEGVANLQQVEIQWNGARPFPVTQVSKLRWNQELDMPITQSKVFEDFAVFAVRSPHKVKTQELKCPLQVTIGEAATSFLAMSKVQTSVMCMQNGQLLDPALKFRDVNNELVLEFRICPLLGGAKADKNEAMKNKLRTMLVDRGVPEDVVGERVSGLLSKVAQDKLNALGDNNDPNTWKNLKELASAAQFRLITPAELKTFQQNARKSKPNEAKEEKRSKRFTPEAHAIRVDPAHFQADGQPVTLIEASRFGPDQTGLCIVTPTEARQCLQCGAKSCDPLALLVIGDGVQNFGSPFTLPAHLVNGSPVIVRACLLQCGDVDRVQDAIAQS